MKNYNFCLKDNYYYKSTFEQTEVAMQRKVMDNLLTNDINIIIGGDLINQIAVSTYASKEKNIPFLGVYSACATFIESMLIASSFIEKNYVNNIMCITSSHNLTAERQFRYPVEYGNNKSKTATSTLTGAVGTILSNIKTKYKVIEGTIGKIVDMGIKDVNHMGAVMAPACADTLYTHLKNLKRKSSYYDLIITGDLGRVGLDIMKEYYESVYHEKINNIIDAGASILDYDEKYAGGSGPCCLPLWYFCNVIGDKRYKRVLLLGTGSLHNSTFVNQKLSIPAICHAIAIEVI